VPYGALSSSFRSIAILAIPLRCGASGAAMVKIQVRESKDRIVLEVEGRLTGAFVPEVQSAWSAAIANRPSSKVHVDLKNVTCVDREGRALLRSMHGQGVEFLRAGIATQDILDEILQKRECGD
jgi:hypothetical protein